MRAHPIDKSDVFTLTKRYACNAVHHKKSLYPLVIEKKIYTKMSSVHGFSLLTVSQGYH